MKERLEYPPYPVAVKMRCPECGEVCNAAEHCGWEIMESDWGEVTND